MVPAGENPNTLEYWEGRFSSGDWEECRGREQTAGFAFGQMPHLRIPRDFDGTIVDFGCGLGDAMPVYRDHCPSARLVGVDVSPAAIAKCRDVYGEMATFVAGDHTAVPECDIVIASNVFEHLSDDLDVARALKSRCRRLEIVVPYRESPLYPEHVNSYDAHSFEALGDARRVVFACRGWSQYGRDLWWEVRAKNVMRALRGEPLRRRLMQVLFDLPGALGATPGEGR